MTTHRIKDNAGRWHRVSKSTAKSGSHGKSLAASVKYFGCRP